MGIGFPELLIILVIVFLVFGAGKLPQVMGQLGKGVQAFKEGAQEAVPAKVTAKVPAKATVKAAKAPAKAPAKTASAKPKSPTKTAAKAKKPAPRRKA